MTISEITPWNDLLDIASDGGLEVHLCISGSGHGSLGFEVWPGSSATPAGLAAGAAVTQLFNDGGQNAAELFDHCLSIGAVYCENLAPPTNYRGPFMSTVKRDTGAGATLQ